MKLRQLANPHFQDALRKLSSEALPLPAAFKIKSIRKKVEEEIEKYESTRMDALSRFGKKDEEGKVLVDDKGQAIFDQGQIELFSRELEELLQLDIPVPTISFSELGDNMKITANDLFLLDGIIV